MNGRRARLAVCGSLFGLVLPAVLASACDTPVYRYAMYRWPPAPYVVYYLHRGQPPKEDAEVNKSLEEAATQQAAANLTFRAIDVSQPAQLESLPEAVKKSWESRRDKPLPVHLVFSPRETELWSGRLDAATARAMLDSPVRKQIGQLLHDHHGAVLIFLPGKDASENKRAEKALRDAMARAAAPPPDPNAEPPAKQAAKAKPDKSDKPEQPSGGGTAEQARPAPAGLQFGLLILDRSDPKEPWLLRCLAAIEDVPADRAKEPMLYAVFGRGRGLGPCIGKAIDAENLDQLTGFLTGACSCVIKDQNPGVDLLFAWDWEATAERMAADEQANKGEPSGYQEVPADPQAKPEGKQALSDIVTGPATPPAANRAPQKEEAVPARVGPPGPVPPGDNPSTANMAKPAGEAETPRLQSAAEVEAPQENSFASRQIWVFGIGFGVVAAAVVAAGLVLLRKSQHDSP